MSRKVTLSDEDLEWFKGMYDVAMLKVYQAKNYNLGFKAEMRYRELYERIVGEEPPED